MIGKECDCPCHKPGSQIMHFMACCFVCPHCKKRISYQLENKDWDFDMYEKHVAECGGKEIKPKVELPHIPTVGEELQRIMRQ